MRPISTLIPLLCVASLHAQPFNWQWSAAATGDELAPAVLDMVVDPLGNSYVTGQFWGTAQWGSLAPMTAVGEYDVFVVKYDSDGTPLWAAQGGGDNSESAKGITIDAAGNVYITGYFVSPTADFGSTTLSLDGTMDIFCAKLNDAGVWVWARHFGSNYNGEEMGEDIVATPEGSTYVTGSFKYYFPLDAFEDLEGCSQLRDLFLLHLDSDGEPIWAKNPDCTHDDSYGNSTGQKLVLDGLGNIYVGGKYRGDTCFFETDTLYNQQLISGQTYDGLLAKYTLDGEFQWVRGIGGYGYDDVEALATDADGNCYVGMHRESQYNLPEFQVPVSGSQGIYRAVLLKTAPDGEFLWWQRMGNTGYDHSITGLAVDAQADILVSGWFEDRFEIDELVFDQSDPHYGLFVARFANDNTVDEVFVSRNNAPRRAACLGLDGLDNLYVAGSFGDTLTFPGTTTLDVDDRGSFLARSGDMNTGLSFTPIQASGVTAFPMPSGGSFTVQSDMAITDLRVVNTLGDVVLQERFPPTTLRKVEVQENGVYFYTLFNGSERPVTGRMMIQR
ncbi:MAG: hypothetical protein JNL43_03300 [Flavobacteriales bacterium]|nr:hypothetical protein [Flavobacteriales bacterium]